MGCNVIKRLHEELFQQGNWGEGLSELYAIHFYIGSFIYIFECVHG